MRKTVQRITPFLGFDDQAEEAVNFYVSVFKNSRVGGVTRYDEADSKAAGRPAGSVMTIEFELEGQAFTALNGGPHFKFHRGDLVRRELPDAGRGRPLLAEGR